MLIQNTGKHTVKKLHKVACEILKRPETGYTSHTWSWSAAISLANAGVSFINLKHHGQWILDSVVEGYIANFRPLRNERLHCLMPGGASMEMVGQQGQHKDLICSKNQHVELKEMVDLLKPNPSEEKVDVKDGAITFLGFSQIYDPDYEINDGILSLPEASMNIKATTEAISEKKALTKLSEILDSTTSMEAFMQAMTLSGGTTFMNCTFNFK